MGHGLVRRTGKYDNIGFIIKTPFQDIFNYIVAVLEQQIRLRGTVRGIYEHCN